MSIHSNGLKVEDVLFSVHKYYFIRDSDYFRVLFDSLRSEETSIGTFKEDTIRLDGISSRDFERFLLILYPRFVALLFFVICDICLQLLITGG